MESYDDDGDDDADDEEEEDCGYPVTKDANGCYGDDEDDSKGCPGGDAIVAYPIVA